MLSNSYTCLTKVNHLFSFCGKIRTREIHSPKIELRRQGAVWALLVIVTIVPQAVSTPPSLYMGFKCLQLVEIISSCCWQTRTLARTRQIIYLGFLREYKNQTNSQRTRLRQQEATLKTLLVILIMYLKLYQAL
jgi:hypothetical protein